MDKLWLREAMDYSQMTIELLPLCFLPPSHVPSGLNLCDFHPRCKNDSADACLCPSEVGKAAKVIKRDEPSREITYSLTQRTRMAAASVPFRRLGNGEIKFIYITSSAAGSMWVYRAINSKNNLFYAISWVFHHF